jgi:hypothetical protein
VSVTAPRRRAFFGQQIVRLLTKTCVANDLGAHAFTLLAVVAAQQDAAGGRPVSYYNEQLMPLVGIRKWDTLAAVRKACIDAGWLQYTAPPTGARKPGVYAVVIPERHAHLSDSRCDEGEAKPYPQNGDALEKPSPANGDGRGDAHGDGRGDVHGEPPSSSSSSTSFSCRSGCDEPPAKKSKRQEYPAAFEEFWNIYPKRDGHRNGKLKTLKLWKLLPADDRALLLQAAKNFSRSPLALDNKARDPERFLNDEWWREWLESAGATGAEQRQSPYHDAPEQRRRLEAATGNGSPRP